jgi:MoxR-like ATPase
MEALVAGDDPAERARALPAAVSAAQLETLMGAVASVHVSGAVRGYVLDLLEAIGRHPSVAVGPSPRAARALVRAASALSVAAGRGYLSPADVQDAAAPVLAHRLALHRAAELTEEGAETLVGAIAGTLPVPLHGEAEGG